MLFMELLCIAGPETTEIVESVCKSVGLRLRSCLTIAEACELIKAEPKRWISVVTALGTNKATSCWPLLALTKHHAPQAYVIVYSHTAQCGDPKIRLECFKAGAKMVTCYQSALTNALNELRVARLTKGGTLSCPYCKMENLTEDTMHRHLDLYHTYDLNIAAPCPVCDICNPSHRGGLAVHYHNNHGPVDRREVSCGPRGSFTAFALVVCQRPSDGKFLMVQEPLGIGGGYWLPAGRVDPGETLTAGGVREALEEAGVHVEIRQVFPLD